ncbi:MAG: hypothetical protein JJE01_14455 [Gemmatimonadetes bacterium]|nr:hypothetical protein [Gemmatimonadota bacterium]
MSGPGDRFSEQEMARILKTASAGGSNLPVSSRKSGLTVAEIESIAREAGLDSSGIAAAAALVAMERSSGVLGSAGMMDLRREVPGVVSSRDYGRLADTIGDAAGEPGTRNAAFGALDWESSSGASRMRVTVTPESDSTSIRVHTDASALKGLCYVASTAGALALGGITGAITEPAAVLTGVGIMVAAASVGVATGWTAWRVQARRLKERSAAVFAAVSGRAAELARQSGGSVDPGDESSDPGQESR